MTPSLPLIPAVFFTTWQGGEAWKHQLTSTQLFCRLAFLEPPFKAVWEPRLCCRSSGCLLASAHFLADGYQPDIPQHRSLSIWLAAFLFLPRIRQGWQTADLTLQEKIGNTSYVQCLCWFQNLRLLFFFNQNRKFCDSKTEKSQALHCTLSWRYPDFSGEHMQSVLCCGNPVMGNSYLWQPTFLAQQ